MGRKSDKGKLKRMQRKQENLLLAEAQKVVNIANEQKDPLDKFAPFRKFQKGDLCVTLECIRVTELDSDTFDWAFELLKKNMKEFYDNCSWGWSDRAKKEEMSESAAWYLVARNSDGKPCAFSHFRFDMDWGDEVLYCYEIQLEEEVQRKGLGKFMMQILELMGFTANMKKVMLTVLRHNPVAVSFFKALKYCLDETSPVGLFEEYPYEILSKMNKKMQNNTSV